MVRDEQQDQNRLRKLLADHDLRGIADLLKAEASFNVGQMDRIAAELAAVPVARIAAMRGWYLLMREMLPRSMLFRQYLFGLLAGPELVATTEAMVNNARDNILLAFNNSRLSEDELAVVRRLRDRLSPAVYQETCDNILFNHLSEQDQEALLMERLWNDTREKPLNPVGPATPPPKRPSELSPGQHKDLCRRLDELEQRTRAGMEGCDLLVVPEVSFTAVLACVVQHGYHVCDAVHQQPAAADPLAECNPLERQLLEQEGLLEEIVTASARPSTDLIAGWLGIDDYAKIAVVTRFPLHDWLLMLVNWAGQNGILNCDSGYSSTGDYRSLRGKSIALVMTELDFRLLEVQAPSWFFRRLQTPRPFRLTAAT